VALSGVEKAVLEKAEAEANKVLDAARREADAYWERESARLREAHERRVEADRRELEMQLERDAGAKEIEHRLELLKAKNEIIQEVFETALDGIIELPDEGYLRWLREQVARLPEMSDAVLVANERDRPLLERAVRESGRQFAVGDDNAPIRGGFLLRSENVDLDCSIESLMDDIRETLTRDVAERLFGGEEHDET